jgi:hypothetical protein
MLDITKHQELGKKVKSTANVRTIDGGLSGFEGRESFACLLTCYQTVRVIGNIKGQKHLIAAVFEIFDRSFLGEINITSHHSSIIISRSS